MLTHYAAFFFLGTSPSTIYTLSLHDALPISRNFPVSGRRLPPVFLESYARIKRAAAEVNAALGLLDRRRARAIRAARARSEEHTSELQSRQYLVCRLLLEKKKQTTQKTPPHA